MHKAFTLILVVLEGALAQITVAQIV